MLRYFANIRTGLEKLVRLEISNSSFTGTAEELEVSADSLEIQQSREGRFGAMCSAGWRATVTSDTNFKFQGMLLEGDLDNVCQLFEDGVLMFSGYLFYLRLHNFHLIYHRLSVIPISTPNTSRFIRSQIRLL